MRLLNRIIVATAILVSLSGCRISKNELNEQLIFDTVDPLEKIFEETASFKTVPAHAEVAMGEHATFQFVMRSSEPVENLAAKIVQITSGDEQLTDWSIGFVGYVEVGRNTPEPSRDKLYSISGFYPDPIRSIPPTKIHGNQTQAIWITIPIPLETEPGTYKGKVILSGKLDHRRFRIKKDFKITVYPPQIRHQTLWLTNWFTVNPQQLSRMNQGIVPEQFSEEYWSLVRLLAKKMADYRQNVALISPLQLADYTLHDTLYSIDFSNFTRMVEIFMEEGVIGRIEGGHIGGRDSTWISPFVVYVPVIEEDTTIFEKFPISNDTAKIFYRQFIPELDSLLSEKGWSGIYLQHIADEPIPENIDSYVEVSKFLKELAPGFKIIEACHTRDLEDMVDVCVPQLNFLHEDFEFYKGKQAAGDEVWYYTCLAPQGNYANRFIELPLIETRILHWINYRFGIDGYLHWGLNHWRGDPFVETTDIITESGNVLPGGDAWIVYPSSHKVLSSLRLEAMRDGVADFELLRMLEKEYPDEAKEIARQVVYQFDRYDIHVKAFREKRRRILELLSEEEGRGSGKVHVDAFISGEEGYQTYRIPSVLTTKTGTILAFAEGRSSLSDHAENDIVLKRSLDGGFTWSPLETIAEDGENCLNNPTAVQIHETGRILLMYQRYFKGFDEHKAEPGYEGEKVCRTYIIYSDDDGVTWSESEEVTRGVKRATVVTSTATGPGIGIELTRGEYAGRIIMPFNQGPYGDWKVYTAYSDDQGKTWNYGEVAPESSEGMGNEVQMVEMPDGRLQLNSRSASGNKLRKVAFSQDGGESWSGLVDHPELPEPECMGSILRFSFTWRSDRSRILFSNPASQEKREMGTIRISYDEGKTWPVSKVVHSGSFAYSCLTKIDQETVGLLYEKDNYKKITFVIMNLDWLEDQEQ
jgi:hypothetical protein